MIQRDKLYSMIYDRVYHTLRLPLPQLLTECGVRPDMWCSAVDHVKVPVALVVHNGVRTLLQHTMEDTV